LAGGSQSKYNPMNQSQDCYITLTDEMAGYNTQNPNETMTNNHYEKRSQDYHTQS